LFVTRNDPSSSRRRRALRQSSVSRESNVFLFPDGELFWHGDPDPALKEHTGFERTVAATLNESVEAPAPVGCVEQRADARSHVAWQKVMKKTCYKEGFRIN
jgi:hypothetical protein